MCKLRNLAFHVGTVGAMAGDPERLFDQYPSVQRAGFSVTSHLMWHMGSGVNLCHAAKLILQADPDIRSLNAARIEVMDVVKRLRIPFDLESANAQTGPELQQTIFDEIVKALVWLAKHESLDGSIVKEAADKVRRDGFVFGYYFKKGKSWRSESGRKVRIYLRYDWNRYDVIAEVLEGRKVLGHSLLHTTVPVEYPLPDIVRDLKWTATGKLSLKTIDFATAKRVTVTKSMKSLNEHAATEFDPAS